MSKTQIAWLAIGLAGLIAWAIPAPSTADRADAWAKGEGSEGVSDAICTECRHSKKEHEPYTPRPDEPLHFPEPHCMECCLAEFESGEEVGDGCNCCHEFTTAASLGVPNGR